MPSQTSTGIEIRIRPAIPGDVPAILQFIRELAEFERCLNQVQTTEADLLRDGWGLGPEDESLEGRPPSRFQALIAEMPVSANSAAQAVGFALYFTTYSTWVGHHGIRLEDLYVAPAHRGRGIGKALLARLARIAVEEGCSRLEWDVLTWNEPALAVYRSLGAVTKDDWYVMRLAGEPLLALAANDLSVGEAGA